MIFHPGVTLYHWSIVQGRGKNITFFTIKTYAPFLKYVQLSSFQVFIPKSIVDSLFRERRKLNKTRNVVKHTKSVPGGNICLTVSQLNFS